MNELQKLLNIVEARGFIERDERNRLMTEHTDAWIICLEVIGEEFRSTPGPVAVTPEQLAEIRARIEKCPAASPEAPTGAERLRKNIRAFRSWLRWIFA